ncbi:uncharacterized protein PGTG_18837 [Puccinia graminis f. sp. tritici CRL 75-36-700-3]|uniref:Uncharacterized protein n=1 Tax=Puccinia graminis f. sp. tritici (strain CRL 75-36-700-3 / race SCCL) TaxID=418459 RepID=E3L7Y4_PUCGT|nr:uncharacterized protein PGTG_18837 [Puccinia graminis f. sp. tritici CRL 75-36-700-3]EFP92659.2 hypothetical protein PGTG_18837 [Puccinia graminis f. sp. tritici CRL 75-36-700-3]
MVEANSTRATSKKIKESTTSRLEDIAITKALVPSDSRTEPEKSTSGAEKPSNDGNIPVQAHDGNARALNGSQTHDVNGRALNGSVSYNDTANNGTVYSLIEDISESRRDRAPAAMNIPTSLNVDTSDVRREQALAATYAPSVGLPRNHRVDLTIDEPVVDRSPAIVSSSLMSERQEMWNRATAAQDAGDPALAEMLFKAIGSLKASQPATVIAPRAEASVDAFAIPSFYGQTGVTYTPAHPQTVAAKAPVEPATSKKFFLTEGDLVYAIGSVTNHNSVGFAPFLDENIRKLRSPLPLTIFNRKWQQRAMAHHLDRRQKSDESSNDRDKSGGYKGFAFVQEWTQTYAQWTRNHRAFRKTLNDVYKIIEFSKLLGTHKNNCNDITEEFGFMVAFRYDMEVRNNTFSHRITDEDVKNAIPDISQRKESVVEQCYNQCRNFGELEWEENLYAPGLSHSNHDPLTGCLKQRQGQFFNNNQMIHNPYMQQQQQYGGGNFQNHNNNNSNNNYPNHQHRNYNTGGNGPFYHQSYGQSNFGGPEGKKRPRGGYRGSNYSDNPQGKAEGSKGGKKGNNQR